MQRKKGVGRVRIGRPLKETDNDPKTRKVRTEKFSNRLVHTTSQCVGVFFRLERCLYVGVCGCVYVCVCVNLKKRETENVKQNVGYNTEQREGGKGRNCLSTSRIHFRRSSKTTLTTCKFALPRTPLLSGRWGGGSVSASKG